MNREGLLEMLGNLEPTYSLAYVGSLIKNQHLLLPGDYKNELLKKNNVIVSLLGGHELNDIESTKLFIEKNKRNYLEKEDGKIREFSRLDFPTIWEHLFLSNDEFKKLFTSELEIDIGRLEFVPFNLKKDKEFWSFLQKNADVLLAESASYDIQNDDEIRKLVLESHHTGYQEEIKPGMSKDDYLKFCILESSYDMMERRFFLVPREYKEDVDFVKSVIKNSGTYIWNMLSPELQKNDEILELEFGIPKEYKLNNIGKELIRSSNFNLRENDDLFFKIIDVAFKNNVIKEKERNIYNFCYNETFFKYFKEVVLNEDVNILKLSANEIVEMIMIKKLDEDMKKDIKLATSNKSIKVKF